LSSSSTDARSGFDSKPIAMRQRVQRSELEETVPDNAKDQELAPLAVEETDQLAALSLVLSAVGIDHVLDEGTHQLRVPARDAKSALSHLEQYRWENRDWPPLPPPPQTLHPQSPPTVLMMALLALFFVHTGPWSAGSPWFVQGAIDSTVILERGEWWRLVTALTLHANLAHLSGNCLIGGLVIHLLGKTTGYGLAWLLLLLNGMAGNLLNVVLRRDVHISVGLSTSIFAVIGIFTGLQLGRLTAYSLTRLVLPLGAGAGLLAFLGSEGVQTDLGAHFFGFLCGICWGALLGCSKIIERARRPSRQALCFSLSLAIVFFCWLLAFR